MLPHRHLAIWHTVYLGAALACLLSGPATAQSGAATDDGFLRQNGTTYVVRHGQLRPLQREVRLPNGRTITPEGFVIGPNGQRQPLAEGQACDLQGTPRAARRHPNGSWAVAGGRSAPKSVQTTSSAEERWMSPGQLKKWLKRHGKRKKYHDGDDD
ncbi:hypothetical protein D3Y59_11820 [Hymenobacter oligotrophus]|uniref:DUF6799 domain-containing protein n=1 Tax=Hymenobacter oligotrophus TaxID=2319843 RepID=A0A3B7R1M9_9BACT|nr:DUF6799 domain-containing protein [Hymenobacter oligotrophus]AYA37672.1 hypothetical protein D3Y59_11820 [Hymenobacter oligotrophus]